MLSSFKVPSSFKFLLLPNLLLKLDYAFESDHNYCQGKGPAECPLLFDFGNTEF